MPFDFNLYSSLLLPAFIQAVLFSALLFYRGWQENKLSDRLLGTLLLLNSLKIAFWMLGFAGWYDRHDGFSSFMFYFPFNNLIWIGPLLYFYFLSLTNADFRFSKQHIKHFIIPGLFLLLVLIKLVIDFGVFYPFAIEENTQYGTKGPWAEADKLDVLVIFSYCVFFYYLVKTSSAYQNYRAYLTQNFSVTEEIRFDWLRNILYAISAGVIVSFIFSLIGLVKPGGTSYKFDWYAYLFLGLITYYVSIAGYFIKPSQTSKLHFTASPILEITAVEATEIKEPAPELNDWTEKLIRHMQEKKPYLAPDLNLSDLSKQLKTNSSVLSKVINEGTGFNFNDFINQYRVEEVITKLKSGEQKTQTLLGIAYDCGFNSKATFNRAFKKVTGSTPNMYGKL